MVCIEYTFHGVIPAYSSESQPQRQSSDDKVENGIVQALWYI